MSILEKIAAQQRNEVGKRRRQRSTRDLRAATEASTAPRGTFASSLRRAPGESVQVICEIKKASPSAGVIREHVDPESLALDYESHGAAAISVVTEENFFLGDRQSLCAVRRVTERPVLMKDFVVDPYQLAEARFLGADAVLLIAALFDRATLASFVGEAQELALECLVEVHDETELENALDVGATVVGINNRNLSSFQVSLETTERLSRLLPEDRVLVSESGIRTRDDVLRLEEWPVDAILVGEALMRAERPAAALHQLMGR